MKIKNGLILALMISTAASAQPTSTNVPPPLPAPAPAPAPATPAPVVSSPIDASVAAATNEPAVKKPKKTAKKKTQKKQAVEVPSFHDNQMAVAKQNNINVRGQAHINSEVIAHLKQGEAVTVLKEVTLKHPKIDEPAKWAQIALPAGVHVWVNGTFLDTNQTVTASKLNVRTGPGENYSVIGMLKKGDTVKALNVKGDWAEIDPPPNAYAFVAAHLLAPAPPGTETQVATTTPPVTTPVETPTPVAPAPTENPTTTTNVTTQTPTTTPTVPAPLPSPAPDEPPPPRIVQREGIVGGTVSIQAPSHYELESLDDGTLMDYLYTGSTNLVLSRYKGLTVLVSGEEELDERWPNTPVITVRRIQLVK